MNTLRNRHRQCHFNLTTSPLYLIKLKIAQNGQPFTAVRSVKPIVPNFRRKSFSVPFDFFPVSLFVSHGNSVCLSFCLSVACWYSTQTNEDRITRSSLWGSKNTLVFWHQQWWGRCPLPPKICAQSHPPSSDRKYFAFVWVLSKKLSLNSIWLILSCELKLNCRDLRRVTVTVIRQLKWVNYIWL